MGCFNSKLRPLGLADNPLVTQRQPQSSSLLPTVALPQHVPAEPHLHGVKLYGVATAGDGALLFTRLVIARGHILAAVFEGHISPSAAEYCRSHCWDAFVQASASRQQTPAAATLRALDRGFLTSSKHSLESRLSSGCSATLLHIDLLARIVTVATVGAHGAVGLASSAAGRADGSSGDGRSATAAAAADARVARCDPNGNGSRTDQELRVFSTEVVDGPAVQQQQPVAGHRQLSRFVTLEAPNAEYRRGLSGLVDFVQSALAPLGEHQQSGSAAAAAAATAGGFAPPTPLSTPESITAATTGAASVASGHGGTAAFMRRVGGVPAQAAQSCPQALGFGCAKDALLLAAYENSLAAAAAHAHAQQQQQPPIAGHFAAAVSRLHCGCDVRVSSQPLVAGDECLVLLAGCGGAGGRATNGIGARIGERCSSGAGGGGVGIGTGSIISGGAGGTGGDNSGANALTRSGAIGSGAASGGLLSSSALSLLPSMWGPAGALSISDAVSLAHELAAAVTFVTGEGAIAAAVAASMLGSRLRGPAMDNRFGVVYDSFDSEAAAATEARATAAASVAVGPSGGACPVGDRSAMAVASYAVAAALRNRGWEGMLRGTGAPAPASPPSLSAACVTIWLDWRTSPESGVAGATAQVESSPPLMLALPPLTLPPPPSRAAARWEVLRAYCRFVIARRRRIVAAWHTLAAAAAAPPQVASVLSLGGVVGSAAGGGAVQGSVEFCTGVGTMPLANRTASFTSRPPVMMEFVEELPTPSEAVIAPCAPYTAATAPDAAVASASAAAADAVRGTATADANAAAATLDESHTHSTSAAPYGISGLVMAPMGSTEDLDAAVDDNNNGDDADVGVGSGYPREQPPPRQQAPPPLQISKRSFVLSYALNNSVMKALGLRHSQSTPDMKDLEAAAGTQSGGGSVRGPDADRAVGTPSTHESSASKVLTVDQAVAHEAEAVAFARGSACYSSQPSSSSAVTTAGGGSGGGGGGASRFDWSLVMTSVKQSSEFRQESSAGHTPIPSAAANRLSPFGFDHEGVAAAAAHPFASGNTAATGRGAGGEFYAGVAGGYLGNVGGGDGCLRLATSCPQALAVPPGLGTAMYSPRGAANVAASASAVYVTSWADGGSVGGGGASGSSGLLGFSLDVQPPPGVLVGRRSAGDSADGDGDAAASIDVTETETELVSEDLPQLRIESTAELAALMAEIIITDDGEVVRTGGGAGGAGGGMPPPYNSRSHGLHVGLHPHKGSRTLSRQGSRGWQPRLAIVREDVRETNISTSCSQLLLAEGVRFTAISEERGSSQGSSGAGEHLQGSEPSSSSNSQQSRIANSSNGSNGSNGNASSASAGNGSPNGSVEEQLAALDDAGAAAILVPPSLPRSGASTDTFRTTAVRSHSHAPWSRLGAIAVGHGSGGGSGGGSTTGWPSHPALLAAVSMEQEHVSPSLLTSPAPAQQMPPAPPPLYAPPGLLLSAGSTPAVEAAALADATACAVDGTAIDDGGGGDGTTDGESDPRVAFATRGLLCGQRSNAVAPGTSLPFGGAPLTPLLLRTLVDPASPAITEVSPKLPGARALLEDVSADLRRSVGRHFRTEEDDTIGPAADFMQEAATRGMARVAEPLWGTLASGQYEGPAVLVNVAATAAGAAAAAAAAAMAEPQCVALPSVSPSPVSAFDPHRAMHPAWPIGGAGTGETNSAVRNNTEAGATGWQYQSPALLQSCKLAATTAAAASISSANPAGSLQMTEVAAAADATRDGGAATASAMEAFDAVYSDLDTPHRHRSDYGMVGRSLSASISRPTPLSHHHHDRNLEHQCSLPSHAAVHHQHSASQFTGCVTASSDAGEVLPLQQHPLPYLLASAHHQQLSPRHHVAFTHTHHLYGLGEAVAVPLVAGSAARSCCSATAAAMSPSASPSAATAVTASYEAGGAAVNTATTLDRSWSVGSASGPLYSLLHSTISKNSMTAANSTPAPTTGCDSAHCSGGRLPMINTFWGTNPPPSLQASSPVVPQPPPSPLPPLLTAPPPSFSLPPSAMEAEAEAVAAAATGAIRALPHSSSSGCRPERSSGFGSGGFGSIGFGSGGIGSSGCRSATAADVAVASTAEAEAAAEAAAGVLPSLPAALASSSAMDGSASFSMTLQAPCFLDWEPQATNTIAIASGTSTGMSSGGGLNGGGAVRATAAVGGGGDGGSGDGSGSDDSASYTGMDPMGRRLPYLSQYTVQPLPYNHHRHHRHQALPPTRLSRTGIAAADPTYSTLNAAALDKQACDGTAATAAAAGDVSISQELVPAAAAAAGAAAAAAPTAPALGFRADLSFMGSAAAASGGGGGGNAQSAALPRHLGSSFAAAMYGTYGAATGPFNNPLCEGGNAYDDGGTTNRSGNISRSDASVWNSTSAWTGSTGRTTDTISNRRPLASTGGGFGGGGGSSCMMLPPGVAIGFGLGGGGGGDTSSLLAYNAAYSSVSGLLMTADAGAPGSNTQLLMQMAAPGATGSGTAAGGGGGGGGGNGQNSSQLFTSHRQMAVFPGIGGGIGGGGGGGESSAWPGGPMMAALAAQVRSQGHMPYATSLSDAQQQAHIQQQQLLLAYCYTRGAVDRPLGPHHAALLAARGHLASPSPSPSSPAHGALLGTASVLQPQGRQLPSLPHPLQLQQGAASSMSDPNENRFDRPTAAMYDSSGQAPMFQETIFDSADNGLFLFTAASTCNNTNHS